MTVSHSFPNSESDFGALFFTFSAFPTFYTSFTSMLTPADQSLIAAQMGRVPREVVDVTARCPVGHPCVMTCYPLRRTRDRLHSEKPETLVPFPTLYWLTCPQLCRQVSHLERDGVIAAIEAEVARDETLRAGLLRNHDDYIARRWAVLSLEDRALVEQSGLTSDFQSRGIGGMLDRAAVKCLHLHLAHHLAGGNVIGALLVERFGLKPCV